VIDVTLDNEEPAERSMLRRRVRRIRRLRVVLLWAQLGLIAVRFAQVFKSWLL
jgi:hypothetical protein